MVKVSNSFQQFDADYNIKIAFLGYSGAGKTSIVEKYLYGKFNYNVQATIGCAFQFKNIIENDNKIFLTITDTAGQEKYNAIPKMYYRDINAFVIVYDVTESKSFNNVDYWLNDIKLNSDNNCNIFVVGNKIDIEEDYKPNYNEKYQKNIVNKFESIFGKQEKVNHIEVSAKNGTNIESLITRIINECLLNGRYCKINKDKDSNVEESDSQPIVEEYRCCYK